MTVRNKGWDSGELSREKEIVSAHRYPAKEQSFVREEESYSMDPAADAISLLLPLGSHRRLLPPGGGYNLFPRAHHERKQRA